VFLITSTAVQTGLPNVPIQGAQSTEFRRFFQTLLCDGVIGSADCNPLHGHSKSSKAPLTERDSGVTRNGLGGVLKVPAIEGGQVQEIPLMIAPDFG
jgi:hypothetical protein